jgi:low affinity Fe/Cu permease
MILLLPLVALLPFAQAGERFAASLASVPWQPYLAPVVGVMILVWALRPRLFHF